MTFIINADSVPVLDGWGWADYWAKEDWTKWVRANVEKYGKDVAHEKFVTEWNKQDAFANPYNWAKYDATFVSFLKTSIGVDISSIISAPLIGAEKVVKGVSELAGKAGDTIGNSGGTIKKVIIVAAVLITIVLIYYAYTKIQKAQ
jgi:hypothetical protein